MGTSIRASPSDDLNCFAPLCPFVNASLDRLQDHVQKEHNNQQKLLLEVILFSTLQESSGHESTGLDEQANFASGEEESTPNVAGPSSLGPIRGRPTYLQVRNTPYERSEESSSRSLSPLRRASLGTLSPLHIPLTLAHLSAQTVPSPLNQVAFSCPNSPTPPSSENEMKIDDPQPSIEAGILFNEVEVLAKASFAIIPLPYFQTTPPTRLLVCTKCCHGVLPSSLLSHSNGHNIKLLPADKRNLRQIMDNSGFLDDSAEIPTPVPPCPPIEGILIQNGFSCNLCTYCCVAVKSIQNHFSEHHKGVLGFSKANSTSAEVQALFARRPKYFAVTPSLRGLSEDDLFTVYMRQCAPEIEALRILSPPLTPNEIPPLLKVMQWHEHLKDYTTDRDSVRKLLGLTKLPTSKEGEAWMGLPLRATIEGYMKDVRSKANNASLGVRCLLKECPRYLVFLIKGLYANSIIRTTQNGEHWIPLGDESLIKYSCLLHQWSHAILLSISGHESGYKFPLTEGDLDKAAKLKDALQQSPKLLHIEVFHDFIMPFMYPKVEGRSNGPYTKWDDVFECLFAISALREDGNFEAANQVTQMFAKMVYFIRTTMLYEGVRNDNNDVSLYE